MLFEFELIPMKSLWFGLRVDGFTALSSVYFLYILLLTLLLLMLLLGWTNDSIFLDLSTDFLLVDFFREGDKSFLLKEFIMDLLPLLYLFLVECICRWSWLFLEEELRWW